jgi:BirA family biotin operon repressor/biotin-[acetyl-CoA-carboxylase] ligase
MSPDVNHRIVTAARAAFPGFELRVLARTPSTQDVVRAAARSGAAEGFTCVTGEQTAGRGRQGRRWTAPPDTALLVSILLRPSPAATPGVPIAAGIAVAEAVAAASGVESSLKWPNDVVVDGAKLAGILAEIEPHAGDAVILGCGINLRVPSFPDGVKGVSLDQLAPNPPSWEELLGALVTALRRRLDDLEAGGVPALRAAWRARAVGLGGPVRAQMGDGVISGTAIDIDDDGALVVATSNGVTRLLAGEVHIGT